jgi:hypothetical protein
MAGNLGSAVRGGSGGRTFVAGAPAQATTKQPNQAHEPQNDHARDIDL